MNFDVPLNDPIKEKIKKLFSSNIANMPEREDAIYHHLCEIDPGGFDWEKTQLRADFFGITMILSPDNLTVAHLLRKMGGMLDHEVTDTDLIEQILPPDGLFGPVCLMIQEQASTLWPEETEEFHLEAVRMYYDAVDHLFREFKIKLELLGDLSAEAEDQIMHFLRNHLELPLSSSCAIISNIHYASKFDPCCMNVIQTHFGLLGWPWKRQPDFMRYCKEESELDPLSLHGQLDFMRYDLETNHRQLLERLMAMPETEDGCIDASYSFAMSYRKVSGKAADRCTALASLFYWPIFKKSPT